MLLKKYLCIALSTAILSLNLTACESEPVQKPNPEQQTALNKLHKRCNAASLDKKGHLKHLAAHRRQLGLNFTCDELKQVCEENYLSKACVSMSTVTAIENAHERVCRSGKPTSSACRKLGVCNQEGFTSEACQTAVARYNR
ncbi:MAG: hypothetical protein ABJG88_08570 [Litorimonas sp.]